ncbi:hypothetical protein JF729_07150 [Mycobacterium intracellulare]|uniref:hypothetical protein n=1 Tax=Mycobacterium intracellulare TaxID=1767 RepID=UPI001CD9530A|nr:hypothetical protein [Mycobacterium intracellulare]MCA2247573.1 hypothetical protein [Mycobacterium intracellulare]
MTPPPGAAARRTPIPWSNSVQPHPDVVAAYWDGVHLAKAGWALRRLDYAPALQTSSLTAETPGRRIVTVTYSPVRVPASGKPPGSRQAEFFLRRVAELGEHDQRHATTLLDDLRMLLSTISRTPLRAVQTFAPVPGVAACAQPRALLRATFWQLHTLTYTYGWTVGDIGCEAVGYGFSADIPGECFAVFPASMPADGSAAALLARNLKQLSAAERQTLARLWHWYRSGCSGQPQPGRPA